jgi:hypothetical protein
MPATAHPVSVYDALIPLKASRFHLQGDERFDAVGASSMTDCANCMAPSALCDSW